MTERGVNNSLKKLAPEKQFYYVANEIFFQAEGGIRDTSVTGVPTCALPICRVPPSCVSRAPLLSSSNRSRGSPCCLAYRSEERRAGKKTRSPRSPYH